MPLEDIKGVQHNDNNSECVLAWLHQAGSETTLCAADKHDVEMDKLCFGCTRSFLHGRSFVRADERVTWCSGARGNWCNDCFTAWRTVFSSDHTLPLFKEWLQNSTNMAEWELVLLAFLSLSMEDHGKITSPMVFERVKCIRFILKLTGVMAGNFVVVPLQDIEAMPGFCPDPSALVTIRSATSDRLGVVVPEILMKLRGSLVSRPTSSACPPPLPSRQCISTSSEADLDLIASRWGCKGQSSAASEGILKFEDSFPTPTKSMGRLENKFHAVAIQPMKLCEGFQFETWVNVKESQFTLVLSKLHGLHDEASVAGVKKVIDLCEVWIAGLSGGKVFLKLNRDYTKSNSKQSKLMEMLDPLTKFCDFITNTLNFEVSPSIGLMLLKMRFHDKASTVTDFKGIMHIPLKYIFFLGLEGLMKRACAPEEAGTLHGQATMPSISPDAWLRAMLFRSLASALRGADLDKATVTAGDMYIDISTCKDMLEECQETMSPLDSLLEDLGHMHIVFAAVCEPAKVLASELGLGLRHLEVIRMKDVYVAMQETETGRAVLAGAKCLLQENAKDAVADEKLHIALKNLEDHRLPNLTTTSDGSTDGEVLNFRMLSDMSVVDVLEESLGHVEECFQLWSRVAVERRTAAINNWLEKLTSTIIFYDECLATFVQALTAVGQFGELLWTSPSTSVPTAEHVNSEIASFVALREVFEEHAIDEDPLAAFYERACEFAKSIPDHAKSKLNLVRFKNVIENLQNNLRVRGAVCAVVDDLVVFTEALKSPEEILDEWRAKRVRNSEKSTFISRGICLVRSLEHLLGQSFGLGSDEGELKVKLEEREGCKSFAGSFRLARELPAAFGSLFFPKEVQARVNGSLQAVFASFVENLHLNSLMPTPLAAMPASGKLADWIDSFAEKTALAEQAKSAGKIFASTTKDHHFCSASLFALLMSLVEVVPDRDFSVSLAPLTRTITGRASDVITSKFDLEIVCRVFMMLSHIAIAMMFLRQYVVDEGESCVREYKVKDEVESSAMFLKSHTNELLAKLASAANSAWGDLSRFEGPQWIFSVVSCTVWLQAARSMVPCVMRALVAKAGVAVATLADEVFKVTPKWDHVVTTHKLHVALAKKTLLGWPARSALNSKTIMLHGIIVDINRLHTGWALTPKLEEDPDTKDIMETATLAFGSAKKAIEIIAILNVIYETKADCQKEQASRLLATKGETMPAVLATELQKILG